PLKPPHTEQYLDGCCQNFCSTRPNRSNRQAMDTEMSNEKLSKMEGIKEQSRFLRGTIQDDLTNSEPVFSEDNSGLLKFHGTYQQDNRDERSGGQKSYSF